MHKDIFSQRVEYTRRDIFAQRVVTFAWIVNFAKRVESKINRNKITKKTTKRYLNKETKKKKKLQTESKG